MILTEAQFLYMIIILPIIFGFVLIGEGVGKIVHRSGGWINIVTGAVFILAVALFYLYFSLQT